MSSNRGTDKEVVVHIYNGILLSHEIEWNHVICRDVDGPGECHTEWRKSEREKQILYINAYIHYKNLHGIYKKWYRWSYWQSRIRDTRWKDHISLIVSISALVWSLIYMAILHFQGNCSISLQNNGDNSHMA